MADLLVLLPGIGGSVLRRGGQDVWALSGGGILNCIRTFGQSLQKLRLAADPPDVDDLGDGVTATGLFPDTHLLPGLWKIDGYSKIRQRLLDEFQLSAGLNYFEFPYDWRRDNRVAARKLARSCAGWLEAWRQRSGNSTAKLILLAHSMGGLVARYYLECLEGWRDTRTLITFGTPYRGSVNALNFLSNGFKKQLAGVNVVDLSALIQSFTSVYQLLPIYPCYDPGDGTLRRPGDFKGITGVEDQKAAGALEFHHEISRAVEAHRRLEDYAERGYAIQPIIGIFQPTLQTAKRMGHGVEFSVRYPSSELIDGDGTVPRPSASPLEFDDLKVPSRTYIAEVHGSLQNADPVLVQVAGLISERPSSGFRQSAENISLSVEDIYTGVEPIIIRSRSSVSQSLTAIILDSRTGRKVAQATMKASPEAAASAEFAPLPAGTYRITVQGEPQENGATGARPVHDVFVVAEK
jgi:hypothetical protein